MVANILHADTPPPRPRVCGSNGQNSNLSESGHVIYQIKGNHLMQQYGNSMLLADPPRSKWMGSNGQNSTFSVHVQVAYQINGNYEMQQHGSIYILYFLQVQESIHNTYSFKLQR